MKTPVARFVTATSLLAATLIVLLVSNLFETFAARGVLQKALQQQETALDTGTKIEGQLNKLAAGTQRLASSGNANAQRIVTVLKQNGINIKAQ